MSCYDFKHGDQDVYKQDLEDNIWGDVENVLAIRAGHSVIHFTDANGITPMIERIIDERKNEISMFHSKEDAYELFENAIFNQASTIANWMFSDRRDYTNQRNYAELILNVYMGESTGVSLNSRLEERNANSILLMLRRDYSTTYGFRLETAYPTIDLNHPEPVIKQYDRREIISGDYYQFHSNLHAIAFLTDYDRSVNVSLRKDESYNEYIRFKSNIESASYVAYLYENRCSIRKIDHGEKMELTPMDLETQCPNLAVVLKDALYYQSLDISKNQIDSLDQEIETDEQELDGFDPADD